MRRRAGKTLISISFTGTEKYCGSPQESFMFLLRWNTEFLSGIYFVWIFEHWLVGLENHHILAGRTIEILRNFAQLRDRNYPKGPTGY